MATTASAARDIATSGRDNLTVVAARSVPVKKAPPHFPPTPPNSLSPCHPPLGLGAQLQNSQLEPVIPNLDLRAGQRERKNSFGSPPCEAHGAITPAMLAKFHLPDILLNHGPLAVRHIQGYLTTSVPGFAGIAPGKARRMVTAALEDRGSGGMVCGLGGDVEFEKVGWGRWDARRRSQPLRDVAASRGSPCAELFPTSIPIATGARWSNERTQLGILGTSLGGGSSAAFSNDDRDVTMLENEADKMSIDGSASASCSAAPDDDFAMDDPEDITDDEDWAAVGAAALRARSYQSNETLSYHRVHNSGGVRSTTTGMARPPRFSHFDFSATALGAASDAEEREAVEALLQLGSA